TLRTGKSTRDKQQPVRVENRNDQPRNVVERRTKTGHFLAITPLAYRSAVYKFRPRIPAYGRSRVDCGGLSGTKDGADDPTAMDGGGPLSRRHAFAAGSGARLGPASER